MDGTFLFQGDSVTDCGRDKNDSFSLGSGYVKLISEALNKKTPASPPVVLNRGISGNRVKDLAAR